MNTEQPQAEEPTVSLRAFIITKQLLKDFGPEICEVITGLINDLPKREFEVDEEAIWFKPNFKALIKLSGMTTGVYWHSMAQALETHLISRKMKDDRHWYSIDFVGLEDLISGLNMDVEEMRADAELTRIQNLYAQQSK